MCPIRSTFLLLLASASVFCRHADVEDKHNFGIYGGTPISITEVPFMAQIRVWNETWGCGAAIVAEQFLVTGGGCVPPPYLNLTMRITVGTDKAKSGGKNFEIEKMIRHPKYAIAPNGVKFDIAVIKLKQKLVFNEKINKIKMADSSMILHDGDMMQTIGFGVTEKDPRTPSNQLLSVTIPFVNNKACKKIYENFIWHVREEMICAGGEKAKGPCYVDGGGPLFYKSHLYGLTSWAKPCAVKGYPSVFTSVPFMKDFVEDVIRKNS